MSTCLIPWLYFSCRSTWHSIWPCSPSSTSASPWISPICPTCFSTYFPIDGDFLIWQNTLLSFKWLAFVCCYSSTNPGMTRLIFFSNVITFVFLFPCSYRSLILRRSCLIMGVIYFFRALCMASTQLPLASRNYQCSPQVSDRHNRFRLFTSVYCLVAKKLIKSSQFDIVWVLWNRRCTRFLHELRHGPLHQWASHLLWWLHLLWSHRDNSFKWVTIGFINFILTGFFRGMFHPSSILNISRVPFSEKKNTNLASDSCGGFYLVGNKFDLHHHLKRPLFDWYHHCLLCDD